jgi:tetratricopeptide (TPR) repeat protein
MARYIEMAPDAADPRASYGDLLLRFGRYDEALEQYRKSLELKPDYWYAFSMIGKVYAIKGRLRESEKMMDRSYDLLPASSNVRAERLATLAGYEYSRGNYKKSQALSLEALAIDTAFGGGAFMLTNALLKQGEYDAATQVIDRIHQELEARSLTESAVMADYHVLRARLLSARGMYDGALAALQEALQYTGALNRTFVHREMAEVYLKQGEFESAIDACAEALSINPNAPQALLTLTRVYQARGDLGMTNEVGDRLLRFWAEADPDFKDAQDLRRLLGAVHPV